MIQCEFCPDQFECKEDYDAHLRLAHPDEYRDYRQAKLTQQNIDYLYAKEKEKADYAIREALEQFTIRMENAIRELRPLTTAQALPVIKASPFEAIQLTQVVINSEKSVEEVLGTYKDICQKLKEG